MSQFPILDKDEIIEGVNYLLSGPAGLGQNFVGFSDFNAAYATGNYRPPFSQNTAAELYVAPIALNNAELLDPYTWKFTFASAQPSPPFPLGSPISVNNVNPADYDGRYSPIGVVECTTTYVIARTQSAYTADPYVSGGDVELNVSTVTANISNPLPLSISNIAPYSTGNLQVTLSSSLAGPPYLQDNGDFVVIMGVSDAYNRDWEVWDSTANTIIIKSDTYFPYFGGGYLTPEFFYNSTDCNSRVLVNGAQDRVFISSQLNNTISYTTASGGTLFYTVTLNRYRAVPNNDPVNPDFKFLFDAIIAQKNYTYTGLTGSGTLAEVETIFSTVIDAPDPNYYWYILEVAYTSDTDVIATESIFGVRSLSVQVVKA